METVNYGDLLLVIPKYNNTFTRATKFSTSLTLNLNCQIFDVHIIKYLL